MTNRSTLPSEIPAFIDHHAIIAELNRWGIRDYKIELICGFSLGYIAQLKRTGQFRMQNMSYPRAARLYNFWVDEVKIRTPVGVPIQSSVRAST